MTNKEKAAEIYTAHIALAASDGRLFRKTVMSEIMSTCGCTLAAAATFYNTAKTAQPVEGLGRAAAPAGIRRPGSKSKPKDQLQDENDCFSVIELVDGSVGRCQSFLMQGDASEKFDDKVVAWPGTGWVMIQGLGPNSGDTFKLGDGEAEIKRYEPTQVAA